MGVVVEVYSDTGETGDAGRRKREGLMRNMGAGDWSICAALAVAVEAAGAVAVGDVVAGLVAELVAASRAIERPWINQSVSKQLARSL